MNTINIHIYIQARMSSKRLPNKVMKKICGKSIIKLIVERLKNIKNVNKIVLVTGPLTKNKLILDEALHSNIEFFCGNEENILDRFYSASKKFNSDIIIRVTADCPLIDFNLINKGLEIFLKNKNDVLSVNRKRTYPHGFDFEIFTSSALKKSWMENLKKIGDKEKFLNTFLPPTKFLLEEKIFSNYDLINDENLSNIRLTLDYPEDLEFIKKIYESLYYENRNFTLKEILGLLQRNPELLKINKMHSKFN